MTSDLRTNKHIGRFFVSRESVESASISGILTALQFIPLRVEYIYALNKFEYVGYSSKFNPVDAEVEVPLYDIKVHHDHKSDRLIVAAVEIK